MLYLSEATVRRKPEEGDGRCLSYDSSAEWKSGRMRDEDTRVICRENMYNAHSRLSPCLLRFDMLQSLWLVNEIVGIRLRAKPPLVWFLDKILISLLLSKRNCIFLCLKIEARALHEVRT